MRGHCQWTLSVDIVIAISRLQMVNIEWLSIIDRLDLCLEYELLNIHISSNSMI